MGGWFSMYGNEQREYATDNSLTLPLTTSWTCKVRNINEAIGDKGIVLLKTDDDIIGLNVLNGERLWTYRTKPKKDLSNFLPRGCEYGIILSMKGSLVNLDWVSGRKIWEIKLPPKYAYTFPHTNAKSAVLQDIAIDLQSGKVIESQISNKGITNYILLENDVIGAIGDRYLVRYNGLFKKQAWKLAQKNLSKLALAHQKFIACRTYGSDSRRIEIFDSSNGKQLYQISPDDGGMCASNGSLFIFHSCEKDCNLHAYDLSSGELRWQSDHTFDINWDGQLGTLLNPIATKKHIFYCYGRYTRMPHQETVIIVVDQKSGLKVDEIVIEDKYPKQILSIENNIVILFENSVSTLISAGGLRSKECTEKLAVKSRQIVINTRKSYRKSIVANKKHEYVFGQGQTLLLRPTKNPNKLIQRDKNGIESLVISLKDSYISVFDIHEATAIVVFAALEKNELKSSLYIFEGGRVRFLEFDGNGMACAEICIDPIGRRAALSVLFETEPDEMALRLFDLSKGKEIRAYELDAPSILPVDIRWHSQNIVSFKNGIADPERLNERHCLDLSSGKSTGKPID